MKALFLDWLVPIVLLISMSGCSVLPQSISRDWGEGTPDFAPAQPLGNVNRQYDHWQSIGRVTVENGKLVFKAAEPQNAPASAS